MRSLLVLSTLAVAGAALAVPATLTISAFIDGRSDLVLTGNSARWIHLDYDWPGLHDGHNDPTYFSSTLNGSPVMTNVGWTPAWTGYLSDTFTGIDPAIGQGSVSLEVITARYDAYLVQTPDVGNGWTTVIEFNDNPPGGADWYTVRLNYDAVPEPASLAAMGLGLAALARRRKA